MNHVTTGGGMKRVLTAGLDIPTTSFHVSAPPGEVDQSQESAWCAYMMCIDRGVYALSI